MARTEAAKALEAKQKAEMRAARERRKTSEDPRDWGTVRTIRELYKMIAAQDPKFPALFFLTLLGPFLLLLVLGLVLLATVHLAWYNVVLLALLGLVIGLFAAQVLLRNRGKSAAVKQHEGQVGSGQVALQMLPKGWTHDIAIAFTRQQDLVHRALGPGGLFLIGEGDAGRVRQLMNQETKRHETALYGVKVQKVMIGNGEGQVPLKDLTKYLAKQPKVLDPAQVESAGKRLKALDGVRRKLQVPQGPMPTSKGSRAALRGR